MSNINKKVLDLLNKQADIELGNATLYRQLSAIANKLGFLNTEKILKKQYEDELIHFNKIFEYILDRNCEPIITQIKTPRRDAKNLEDIFKIAIEREEETTREIKLIRQSAINLDDQLTEVFLNELILEQIEEENFINDILAMLSGLNGDKFKELMIDERLNV